MSIKYRSIVERDFKFIIEKSYNQSSDKATKNGREWIRIENGGRAVSNTTLSKIKITAKEE